MPSNNFSLYRSLDLSQYYKTFKKGYDGKVLLGFAVLAEPQSVILGDFKTVTNVKFIPESKIESNSPEWIAKEVQERAKQDARKSSDYLT